MHLRRRNGQLQAPSFNRSARRHGEGTVIRVSAAHFLFPVFDHAPAWYPSVSALAIPHSLPHPGSGHGHQSYGSATETPQWVHLTAGFTQEVRRIPSPPQSFIRQYESRERRSDLLDLQLVSRSLDLLFVTLVKRLKDGVKAIR